MNTSRHEHTGASDQVVWDRVLTLHARVERDLAQAMTRRHGIGLSEYRALESLSRAKDGELRMQELADAVGLGQSSVTRLVARLENAGFALKDLCASDRRGVYAIVTDLGRERYRDARATYAEVLAATLNSFTADPDFAPTVQSLRGAPA
ncbi:MarR family winged helix-turn-helix transcriptional regulator [Streptomyces sp. BI20]|uniref:MarR family winged helix-turn-helix transcriptional regulator n=1 Tax=Streptomyces sp. BI20 TaxID=3403460 RepID=UPI003C762BD7